MELQDKKREIVNFCLEHNILVTDDFLEKIREDEDLEKFYEQIKSGQSHDIVFFNELFEKSKELEKAETQAEKTKLGMPSISLLPFKPIVNIIVSHEEEAKKREVQDFVAYFGMRYKSLKPFLEQRQELQNVISINRIKNIKAKENTSLIGLVLDKTITANNNVVFTLEDNTGTIKVVVNKNKPEIFETAKDIVLDEVIGVAGISDGSVVFANNILLPDIPVNKEIKKCSDDCYAIFLSDLHVGSKKFLPKEFSRFISWIRGEAGNDEQREIAQKVAYIFIAGDLVDGVGVYPEQDLELEIKDIEAQYRECARLLRQIPQHIPLVVCPGNHDAMRIAEPQLGIYEDFASELYKLPNLIMVSNPAFINIHKTENFPGFDVLLYHGYSFDYYIANVDSIRGQGGYDRGDLVMKFLLRRRHLSPSHSATLYMPYTKKDPLVIDRIPDFFITGHIHKTAVANYRNITLVSGSCWQAKTSFQEKVGHNPEPARVPVVNLKTRKLKMLRF